jgi:nucleoside-diphosphate-sugar epimerase|tara:strand:- start:113 stop:1051 length:939 start_codon:yes stop_codon:yes gene_type:complete
VKNVLLTGASGFVGGKLLLRFLADGFHVLVPVRKTLTAYPASIQKKIDFEFSSESDWSGLVNSQNVVVHCAGRAHDQHESGNPLLGLLRVNVDATLALARHAAAAGVQRFIFISSIGVNGNINTRPFRDDDQPSPVGYYCQSKWAAEQGLWMIQQETNMEVVVIRPPLVYGPDAPGNFGNLVRWVEKGIPLPLGAIHNKRSLVGIDNLVDLVVRCIDHPAAANQVFLAGDGEDLSTTELLRGVGEAMGKPARLIPVPASMLQFGATLLGKKAMAQRLLGSLQVDISKTCELLDWKPPYKVQDGLKRCFVRSN